MKRQESEEKFLKQSYLDAWNNYQFLLSNPNGVKWDWVAITASNERQANAYRIQLERRRKKGYLPRNTKFIVVPDFNGKRIGSGGATLHVLKNIAEEIGQEWLEKQKILVIHSGGDSRRIPQYSACGKLFSPIPRILPNGESSTLFDELFFAVSLIPSRILAGMLILPGDTQLLFNPLQLELSSCEAAGLSMKTNLSEGKEHGVFLEGKNHIVKRFLHKQPESILREYGAVDARNDVDIDTGCIWFGSKLVKTLTDLFYIDGMYCEERFFQFVNERVRLSFYADFVAPLSSEITWEDYQKEKPEGMFSEELIQCRKELWKKLHSYQMTLIRMAPARYLPIGTTNELFRLMVCEMKQYQYLDWKKRIQCNIGNQVDYSGINTYIEPSVILHQDCYIENSILKGTAMVASHTIVSGIFTTHAQIPEHVVLHGLKLKNGKYVCRIYGLEDNPKGSVDSEFLGSSLRELRDFVHLDTKQLWTTMPPSIWNANLYPECTTCEEAVDIALIFYRMMKQCASPSEVERWKKGKRYSLESSFADADMEAILSWQEEIKHLVVAENCVTRIRDGEDIRQVMNGLSNTDLTEWNWIKDYAEKEENVFLKMRFYLGLSFLCGTYQNVFDGMGKEAWEEKAYEIVKQAILEAVFTRYKRKQNGLFVLEEVEEKLPVRVNFCGSPSDAAPYCLEHGGTMLDAALLLRGEMPIQVVIRKTNECVIRFVSKDLKEEIVCTRREEIQDCGNPYDTFALHKAVLMATGVIPFDASVTLQEICHRMGGGLTLITEVNVPKGSGLGTSSLLVAAAVKGIHRIMGETVSNDQIYAEVFLTEQLMNTGGGWQDQAGGLTPGIKLMYTKPGIDQQIRVEYLELEESVKKELQERFVLIFSGQRRLAKNVLREEMNQCARNQKQALEIMEQIQRLCVLMKFELERGDITGFAKNISAQFAYVKQLDEGASNTCIEYIFECCEDLIDGKSVYGAGGGGFLQVILKKGVSKEELQERLQEVFKDCGVEVWDTTFL